jgi:hypothetical protein
MAEEEWSKLYGEVVWAKFGPFPWWPSFIYDPSKLPTTCPNEIREKALKVHLKQYVIYFYADSTWGYAPPKSVKVFSEETTAQFRGQKIAKGYQDNFVKAIDLAGEQIKLPVSERMSWHYSNRSNADSVEDKEGDDAADDTNGAGDPGGKVGKKRPRGRPKKESKPKKGAVVTDLYFADNHEPPADAAEEEAEEEEAEEEEEVGEEEVSVADEGESEEEESAGSEYEKVRVHVLYASRWFALLLLTLCSV